MTGLEDEFCVLLILLMVQKSGINSPVEFGSLSHYLQGFSTIPGG